MSDPSRPTEPLREAMTAWRHDLHAHPELGFAEHRTAARVAELLAGFGLEVHRGIGGTGVVGVLRRGGRNRAIGLRADMDALPITETAAPPHRSCNPGAMHACGHDGHTAMLLGAAAHLAAAGELDGTVVFIFQPNEEHGLGARAMLDDRLLERFELDEVYGMHNVPGLPVGSLATRSGAITASESLFEIEIRARGGHAALPHMGIDAIVVGAGIVQALQTIISRKLDPVLGGVVSVTEFVTDGARNVLPGRATLRGDARALGPEVNEIIEARMRQIVAGVCSAHGVSAEVSYRTELPAVINAPGPVGAAARAAGPERLDAECAPRLFSEDFAHLARARPGCFVLIGNGTEGAHGRALHSADYDFNDAALTVGSSFWVRLVEGRLGAGGR